MRPPSNPVKAVGGPPSVWVRVAFTVGLFWGVVLVPLAGMWQNTGTYAAALVPPAVFLAAACVFLLHIIWTDP